MKNVNLDLAGTCMGVINDIYEFKGNPYFVILFDRKLKYVRFCVNSDKHETLFYTTYQIATYQMQPQDCIKDFCNRFQEDEVYQELVSENLITVR